jgi:hypothetical protein
MATDIAVPQPDTASAHAQGVALEACDDCCEDSSALKDIPSKIFS